MNKKMAFALFNFLYSATYLIAMNGYQSNMHQDHFVHTPLYSKYQYHIPNRFNNDVLILNNIIFNRSTGKAHVNPHQVKEFINCRSALDVFNDDIPWIKIKNWYIIKTIDQISAPELTKMNEKLNTMITSYQK